jgi:hypothetical protein
MRGSRGVVLEEGLLGGAEGGGGGEADAFSLPVFGLLRGAAEEV